MPNWNELVMNDKVVSDFLVINFPFQDSGMLALVRKTETVLYLVLHQGKKIEKNRQIKRK